MPPRVSNTAQRTVTRSGAQYAATVNTATNAGTAVPGSGQPPAGAFEDRAFRTVSRSSSSKSPNWQYP
ncbi:hypothetical protein Ndes2437B_g08422 [Nannochloris sp. 'desiccata']